MQCRHERPQVASLHSNQRLVGGRVHLHADLCVTARFKLTRPTPGIPKPAAQKLKSLAS